MTERDLELLAKQRRRLVMNRVATVVSVGEELVTILEEPVGETVEQLISTVATLVDLTSAHQSPALDPSRNPNKGDRIPSFQPAWAKAKLDQIDRQLYELAGGLAAWCHHPHDPHRRPHACDKCGRNRGKDDLYCRQCGTPTLHAYRRCWVRACPNRGKPRRDCPPDVDHPKQGGDAKSQHPGNREGQ